MPAWQGHGVALVGSVGMSDKQRKWALIGVALLIFAQVKFWLISTISGILWAGHSSESWF